MIRAAAKNHADVAVVVEPADYDDGDWPNWRSTAARPRSRCASSSPPRPMRAPPPTTPRSPTGSPTTLHDDAPRLPRLRRPADRGAALRREPAPERGVLSRPRTSAPASPRARQVQGKQLSYNNINDTDAAYECVAEFDPARTAACAIIKHANPCGVAEGARPASTPIARRWPAIRSRPSAASSRSTARSTPKRRKAITEIFTEVIIAPDATDEAIADRRRRRRICACCSPAACPIRARRASPSKPSPAACWCSRATTPWSTTCTLKVVTQARADAKPNCATCASPSASPSTSSRTPSSMPRTAPPSASAPAR